MDEDLFPETPTLACPPSIRACRTLCPYQFPTLRWGGRCSLRHQPFQFRKAVRDDVDVLEPLVWRQGLFATLCGVKCRATPLGEDGAGPVRVNVPVGGTPPSYRASQSWIVE